jgi:hypothetical protein
MCLATAELDTAQTPVDVPELDGSPVRLDCAQELDSRPNQPPPSESPQPPAAAIAPLPAQDTSPAAEARTESISPPPASSPSPSSPSQATTVAWAGPDAEPARLEAVDEYEALRLEHEKLEARRRTLQELKEVEERQQALLEKMQRLRTGGPPSSG